MLRFFGTKIGISLLIALAVIGASFAVKYKKTGSSESVSEKIDLLAEESVRKALESGQLDNPDWEDTLRALKIGTTTEDIIKNMEEKASATSTPDKPLTATDRFARELMSEYVKLKDSGVPIDETTGLKLVNSLLSKDYGGPPGEKTYSAGDIRISENATLAEIKRYGNTIAQIFDEPLPKGYENEMVLVNRINEEDSADELEKLALNIARYEKIRENLSIVAAPSQVKNIHLSLLNSLSAIIEGVRGMKLLSTDPIGATNMILRYEDGIKSFEVSADALSAYFKKQNIVFSSTEPGFIFVK